MYIEPNTVIRILKDCPLDTTYDHTLYFSSKANQTNYFTGLTKYTFNDQSYQRVRKGRTRVQRKAEDLYDCNYMMFQNSSFGNKWFYAFIKSVEYVNNVTSEIEFEIDVMQTWYFDYTLEQCFVEREHSATDVIGEHIEPENVNLGEQVYNGFDNIYDYANLAIILGVVNTGEAASSGNVYDGVYCGSALKVFRANDVTGINTEMAKYLQAPDTVVNLYMCPKSICYGVNDIPDGGDVLPSGRSGYNTTVTLNAISSNQTLDGYTPKNKKLYTYPYNYYQVNNASGQSLSLRYEFFESLTPKLYIIATLLQPVQAVLYPIFYKGSGIKANTNESIAISNFPICSWNFDAYQAWVAQNSVPLAMEAVSSIGKSAVGFMNAINPFGQVTSLVDFAFDALQKEYSASIQADISKGNPSNGSANSCNALNQFFGGRMSCCYQVARMIDDYFTRFGYQTNLVKTPNTHSRPHWNYVKTIGCIITGSIPSDDAKAICKIYDNGITFWKNGSEVGNYSLNNAV